MVTTTAGGIPDLVGRNDVDGEPVAWFGAAIRRPWPRRSFVPSCQPTNRRSCVSGPSSLAERLFTADRMVEAHVGRLSRAAGRGFRGQVFFGLILPVIKASTSEKRSSGVKEHGSSIGRMKIHSLALLGEGLGVRALGERQGVRANVVPSPAGRGLGVRASGERQRVMACPQRPLLGDRCAVGMTEWLTASIC